MLVLSLTAHKGRFCGLYNDAHLSNSPHEILTPEAFKW